MIMKFWIIVFLAVMEIVGADNVVSEETKDHNKEAHKALCDLMKAAANKWREVEKRVPTDPLRNALVTTLFGYGTVGTLETLRSVLPSDYDDVEGTDSSRSNWCGQPLNGDYQNNYPRWSGHSAPHDMVCLCTLGNNTWPLVGSEKDKLCGQNKNSLGGDNEWWSGTNNTKKRDAIEKTWKVTVNPCLSGSSPEKDLKEALKKFTGKIVHTWDAKYDENHYVLGQNGTDYISKPCDGSPKDGLCVKYYNSTKPFPWWVDLEKALIEDAEIQKQRAEEERRKQQDRERKTDEPHAEALTSGPQTNNQTEQHRNANLTEKLRKYNIKSGTPISRPSSWLLRAVFLF
ncbi:Variant surface glycoprotein [Trypanosoma congolense IL3000]|uniref:Variant surface glycoprotein n=1 Tax=Trypanosoma congolense (strain IL3000) TaxID=1068625 RepID=F9WJS9_TRYCI|nr:Variant surface glycoprotein [Trypanosoma congolense IL3000]